MIESLFNGDNSILKVKMEKITTLFCRLTLYFDIHDKFLKNKFYSNNSAFIYINEFAIKTIESYINKYFETKIPWNNTETMVSLRTDR